MISLKIKKIKEDAKLPSFAYKGDAGMDLFAFESVVIKSGERKQVPTGIAIEIPNGYAGLIWDKSGLSMKHGIKTLGGVVDAGYRGEIIVGIVNLSKDEYVIEKHHKVAQMLIQKTEEVEIQETEDLGDAPRSNNGFGSTGQ